VSALARRGRGTPCEPCMLGRLFPEKIKGHECTGRAAFSDGSVPCPCCGGTVTPMRFCRRCNQPIRPGEEHGTQLAQSASGGGGATNHIHAHCPSLTSKGAP
jgi:hypothetical protein